MMRPRKQVKRPISKRASIPAPTGGLNAREPISDMKITEALTMDNWFPTPTTVDIRNGYEGHVTGGTDPFETLMAYSVGATAKLFGVSDGNIYDVTTAATSLPSAAVTGLTNSRFQHITMGTAGGYFLMAVNGADKLQYYTGSAWDEDGGGTYTITGVDTADCIHINNFKNRVFLIEKDSFTVWYLPVASIAGTASDLDLSGLFKLGGYLMAMENWTIDNAAGIDDYAAFITSEGEVALYKGTNPGDANAWALVGTFRMGAPLGRRCAIKAGSDVLVLTRDGAMPLSKALLTDRSQTNQAATDKIRNLINQDVASFGENFGWQAILHPVGNKLIINVPEVEGVTARQYVMNTTHGAWARFVGWNAICWATLGDALYFGGVDGVYRADYGNNDDGDDIQAVCQQAFSYFGDRGRVKRFTMARPIFLSNGTVNPSLLMNVDFEEIRTTVPPSFIDNIGTAWDDGDWDETDWTAGDVIVKRWQAISGVGYSGGLRVVQNARELTCRWQSTDIVFEPGTAF